MRLFFFIEIIFAEIFISRFYEGFHFSSCHHRLISLYNPHTFSVSISHLAFAFGRTPDSFDYLVRLSNAIQNITDQRVDAKSSVTFIDYRSSLAEEFADFIMFFNFTRPLPFLSLVTESSPSVWYVVDQIFNYPTNCNLFIRDGSKSMEPNHGKFKLQHFLISAAIESETCDCEADFKRQFVPLKSTTSPPPTYSPSRSPILFSNVTSTQPHSSSGIESIYDFFVHNPHYLIITGGFAFALIVSCIFLVIYGCSKPRAKKAPIQLLKADCSPYGSKPIPYHIYGYVGRSSTTGTTQSASQFRNRSASTYTAMSYTPSQGFSPINHQLTEPDLTSQLDATKI